MTTNEIEKVVEELNTSFMAIIERFAPNWYGHLVDSDENMGEDFRNKIRDTLTTLTQKYEEEKAARERRFIEILENNRRETLYGEDADNELADDAINNFIIAVKDDLSKTDVTPTT